MVSPADFVVEVEKEALPTIGGFLPTGGRVNESVQISGTTFNRVTRVSLNGVNAPVSQGSAYLIVSMPLGDTSGPFRLESRAGMVTSPSPFTVLHDPVNTLPSIADFAPTSGLPGTEIDLTGTNFGSITSVQFNVILANFTVLSANLLQTTVPLEATTGPIRVNGPGGTATSTTNFTVIRDPVKPSVTVTVPNGGERYQPGQQVII